MGLGIACGGGAEQVPATAPEANEPAVSGEPEWAREGHDRLGRPVPEWGEMAWLNTAPLSLRDLRGRVVLIRFWTESCPFCRATAPALAELDAEYRERGVTVVGMYHPKPRGTLRTSAEMVDEVAETVEAWRWRFPVALDTQWAALDASGAAAPPT